MKFAYLLIACAILQPLLAEPSAFELQSGATKKDINTLKSTTKQNKDFMVSTQARIQTLEQSVDGLKTIIEGLSLNQRDMLKKQQNAQAELENLKATLSTYYDTQKAQEDSLNALKEQANGNSQAILELTTKLNDLSEKVLSSNQSMLEELEKLGLQAKVLQDNASNLQEQIQKNEQQNIQKQKEELKLLEQKKQDILKSNSNKDLDSLSKKKILNDGIKFIRQKNYKDSSRYLNYLISKKYQVAKSTYYLGELEYAKKDYKNAIFYYKKSVTISQKGSYMPILMWHTAWSFKYLKDETNYKEFLSSLASLYPNSEQGQKAKEILTKLKDK